MRVSDVLLNLSVEKAIVHTLQSEDDAKRVTKDVDMVVSRKIILQKRT